MTDPIKQTVVPVVATTVTPATPVTFTAEQFAAIQQMVVAATMAAQAGNARPAQTVLAKQYSPECIDCKQSVSACKGKHVEMVVYPTRYPEFWKYFKGVKINGVEYVSHTAGQRITVPAALESTITNAIVQFEDNERTMLIGRNKQHSSGSIGRGSNGAVQAVSAWR